MTWVAMGDIVCSYEPIVRSALLWLAIALNVSGSACYVPTRAKTDMVRERETDCPAQ